MDDKILIEQIKRNNDQVAFSRLMAKYKRSLYFTMYKMVRSEQDAEDLTQEAFVKAFDHIHSYNDQYAFGTWLFRIATNNAIDYIRKKRIQTTSLDNPLYASDDENKGASLKSAIPDHGNDPEEEMIEKQRHSVLKDMIGELSGKYRELVKLRYFEELKYEEIAERLELPVGTVKVRLSRARKKLLELYNDKRDGRK